MNTFGDVRFNYSPDSGGADGGGELPPTDEGQQSGNPPAEPVVEPVKSETKADEIKLNSVQLKERLDRAQTAAQEKLIKELGFASAKEIKAAITAGKTALDAQKTEAEKQAELLKQLQERGEDLERRAKEADDRAQAALMQSEALSLMAGRFANPKAAMKLLDMTDVNLQDGVITGLKEAVEKLAEAEPWTLAQQRRTPNSPLTANPKNDGDPAKETDAEKRSRYFGNIGGGADFFKGGGVKVTPK